MAFKFLGQRQLGKLPSRWVSTILMVAIDPPEAPCRCGGRVVVLMVFLGLCVTENVRALTACPAGGHFLYRQKVTKERLKGFALENPTRGFPLDLPADGANAPYPLIPAGLFVFPAGGSTPPACGLRGRRRAAGGVGWDSLLVCGYVSLWGGRQGPCSLAQPLP